MEYIIISPVRNEEKYIEETIFSIISQNVKPCEWIIVNDGSHDATEDIIKKYLQENPWIKLINKENRGHDLVGRGVIESFNEGLKNITHSDWDYIAKMDCDIALEKDFFEKLFNEFKKDDLLGISGGTSYIEFRGKLHEEKMPIFHPWAGARVYRRECFKDINGLQETLGWDTIDLLRAHMKKRHTKRFKDLKIIHKRVMASRNTLWEGKLRTGRNFYITGYHPLFLIARSIYRLFQHPYFIESFGVICGYIQAMLKREKLVVTTEEKEFLRREQIRRLFVMGESSRGGAINISQNIIYI